ncbi:MAG: thiamine phosphate synthase [Syntrophaceae bacterium]|nr:thiamine phosphate synthase [Syntrophaceae bacterium]
MVEGLYLVTDRELCGVRGVESVVEQAVKGGVRYVQLREKDTTTRDFIELAARIKDILAPMRVPLIINDRVDVALAVGADGVHVGQDDMPYQTARRIMGPSALIGLSVESWDDVVAAQSLDVDYLGVSPVFSTPTKTDTKGVWGLEGLARIRAYSRHPLVGIGGINAANTEAVVKAGADCVAVVSAICAAEDPRLAAKDLDAIVQGALSKYALRTAKS